MLGRGASKYLTINTVHNVLYIVCTAPQSINRFGSSRYQWDTCKYHPRFRSIPFDGNLALLRFSLLITVSLATRLMEYDGRDETTENCYQHEPIQYIPPSS
jgi:hypothetical protein